MPYVYSTLTNDQLYTNYRTETAPGVNQAGDQVHIKGGSNRINKVLQTPRGVATFVTEAQLAILEANPDFQLHTKNGFVKADKDEVHPDKAVADMDKRDKSSPIVPGDYKEGEKPFYENTDSGAKPLSKEKLQDAKGGK